MGSDSETERSNVKEKKKITSLAPIAKPLAGKKLCKRTLKLVRKASESKCLKRGVKEVVKSIRRGHKGLCIIAGNISPIDVITHVPILCEESDIPYVYVTSKEELASAGATKRPTCCVLVLTKPTKGEMGKEDQEKLKADYDQVVSDLLNSFIEQGHQPKPFAPANLNFEELLNFDLWIYIHALVENPNQSCKLFSLKSTPSS